MTNEEAIKYLRQIYPNGGHCWLDLQRIEAIEMAIEALSQPSLPSNLDEAAHNHAANNGGRWLTDDIGIKCFAFNPQEVKDAFKAGAEWMAGQYEKIEGELVDWYSTSDGKDYCCGVKTIDAFEVPEGFYIRKKQ